MRSHRIRHNLRPALSLFAMGLMLAMVSPAHADEAPPIFSFALRNTLDGWTVFQGPTGEPVALDKLQLSATVTTDRLGLSGLSFHSQLFNLSGSSLSEQVHDIQTADAIDAVPTTRLFEAWAEKTFSGGNRSLAVRAGLMDLNQDFDAIEAAGLFLNSSHGIGADIARSGVNGPSIYPVSALGVRLAFSPAAKWTLRYGVFDGVAGDPARPRAFVAAQLGPEDGILSIGQIDFRPNKSLRVAVGAWRYSHPMIKLDSSGRDHGQGIYGEIESKPTADFQVWLRLGIANGSVQSIKSYQGAGITFKGRGFGRPDDSFGFAIARAANSHLARAKTGVEVAETSLEATYQLRLSKLFSLQPDIQYILSPSLAGSGPDALVAGLRLTFIFGGPKAASPTDAGDPTLPTSAPPAPEGGSADS